MKKFILLGISFIFTTTASFADCRCGSPKFTSQDEMTAIENFVANKLENGIVTNVELTEKVLVAKYNPSTDPSRPRHRRNRAYHANYRGWVEEEFLGLEYRQVGMTKCEVECANKENSINKFRVEYTSNNKKCAADLKVYMTSKMFGFKSLVKQKLAPVCE
jgi:hypothetical protein